jgi:glyoxylase-like metal-dependent hydrolase (beta-lactamase superfamily II)/peptidoglycan/xylan/chitin deacetylase (PgdA/CDA1 family)
MNNKKIYLAFLFLIGWNIAFAQSSSSPKISFSFDDGSTNDYPGYDSEVWNQMLLNNLKKFDLQAVLFVKGANMDNKKGAEVLTQWDSLGHLIGNHTYNHNYFNSDRVSLDDFQADFNKNDSLIRNYRNYTRLFRFPYLKEGNTIEKRDGFRAFLEEQDYRNGHVTIDASDWYIDGKMVEQLKTDSTSDLTAYKTYYLDHILHRAIFYDSLAYAITGRRINHNLLLHHNLSAALFLDDLIELFQNHGWEIIDVDKAYEDPIYKRNPQNIPAGESLIWALAKESGEYDSILRYPAEDSKYEKEKLDSLISFYENRITYDSKTLIIRQLTYNTFLHVSFLKTENYGNVPCNGMIIIDNGEAIVIDSPIDDTSSEELIDWVENVLKYKTIGVVATHFHIDCLGGLDQFHVDNIKSYANNKTIELSKQDSRTIPQVGFNNYLELKVGDQTISLDYLGEGHTRDNIVCYSPKDHVLFGGCLIKGLGSGKGNLADSNIDEWPATVSKVKDKYAEAKIIIPGHGNPGGKELLEYTFNLFKTE